MKHIQQLDIIPHFAPSETKHLLPFHKPSLITNLFTITQTYIKNGYTKNIELAPDQTLTYDGHPHYSKTVIVWHEDFDNTEEHLRKSLSLGTLLINYYYTLSSKSTEFESKESAGQIIKKQQFMCIREQPSHQKTRYESFDYPKNMCCYNFIKYSEKIVLLFGFIDHPKESLSTLLGNTRQWNLSRLGIPLTQYSFETLDRTIEHIFTAGRGFLRQINDDYNTYKKNVANFLQQCCMTSLTDDQYMKLCQTHRLFESNLQYSIKLYKIKIMYRNCSQRNLWKIILECATEMLLQAPINISCSYAVTCSHFEKQNTLFIAFGLHYLSGEEKLIEYEQVEQTDKQITGLLLSKAIKHDRNLETADQTMRNSMTFLQKYDNSQNPLKRSDIVSVRSFNVNDSHMNQSFVSNASNLSQVRKINMKKIAKLQNEIYEILKLLDANQPILNPTEIGQRVIDHCKWLQRFYKKQKGYRAEMNARQYEMFESLKMMTDELTPEDMHLILRYNEGHSSSILITLMQHYNYDQLITLGKILGLQNLESLFQKTLEKGLSNYRHSIIPFFLKKLLQAYTPPHVHEHPLVLEQVSIPKLIELVETKTYDSQLYSSLITTMLPQLFIQYQNKLKVLSPLLFLYTEHLLRASHHKELVYSFLGQLIFQVLYFENEAKLNSLSNSMYMEDSKAIASLKEKKIIELIREGGFKRYGYEIRNHLYSSIQANKSFRLSDEIVYNIVRIKYPLQTLKFFKVLAKSHINQTIIKFGKFYQRNNYFSQILQKGDPLLCFIPANLKSTLVIDQKDQSQPDLDEFSSISRRILSSQSGIFQQMVTLNPKIKIAGIELASAMKNLTDSRMQRENEKKKKNGSIDQKGAVQFIKSQCNMENYEYIELASSLKDKYIEYHLLNEESKSYFRDCASSVVDQKESILHYIVVSNKVKSLIV